MPDILCSYAKLLFTPSDFTSITSHIHSWALFSLYAQAHIILTSWASTLSALTQQCVWAVYVVLNPTVFFGLYSAQIPFSLI